MANSSKKIYLGLTLGVGESSDSGKRKRFTNEKREYLKEVFPQNPNIDPEQAEDLAGRLDLTQKQVMVWFRSQRHKNKVKQQMQEELMAMYEEVKAEVCALKKRIEELEGGHHLQNKVEQRFQGELKTMIEEIKAEVCGLKKRVEDLEAGHRLQLNL